MLQLLSSDIVTVQSLAAMRHIYINFVHLVQQKVAIGLALLMSDHIKENLINELVQKTDKSELNIREHFNEIT